MRCSQLTANAGTLTLPNLGQRQDHAGSSQSTCEHHPKRMPRSRNEWARQRGTRALFERCHENSRGNSNAYHSLVARSSAGCRASAHGNACYL